MLLDLFAISFAIVYLYIYFEYLYKFLKKIIKKLRGVRFDRFKFMQRKS